MLKQCFRITFRTKLIFGLAKAYIVQESHKVFQLNSSFSPNYVIAHVKLKCLVKRLRMKFIQIVSKNLLCLHYKNLLCLHYKNRLTVSGGKSVIIAETCET